MSSFKFEDNSVHVKDVIDSNCFKLLEEISSEIETQVKRNTRVDTGATKRAWKHVVDTKRKEGTIGNTLENAIWEETGTGEYAIHGDGRKGYWVYVKNSTTNKNAKSSKSYTLAQARWIVKQLREKGLEAYYTKGKTPTRALTKAFETTKPMVESLAKEIFGGIGK